AVLREGQGAVAGPEEGGAAQESGGEGRRRRAQGGERAVRQEAIRRRQRNARHRRIAPQGGPRRGVGVGGDPEAAASPSPAPAAGRAKAKTKVKKQIAAFRKFLGGDPLVGLFDDNPFGVTVTLRDTLGKALGELDAAVR